MVRLEIASLKPGTFMKWMEKRNKVGGQNKVPRLYGDLRFVEELVQLSTEER
ncbi:MAG: hypothetical protein IJ296_09530 [Bacteroidales bacterium]|nr:hypothetical protein [Bacteroidales bacterium]